MKYKLLLIFVVTFFVTCGMVGCAERLAKNRSTINIYPICHKLQQELSTNTGHNINISKHTPIERVRLYRQYQHYQCDEVLNVKQ